METVGRRRNGECITAESGISHGARRGEGLVSEVEVKEESSCIVCVDLTSL